MNNITVSYESTPTSQERIAIGLLKTGADLGELTRNDAAQILRNVMQNAASEAYIHIGGSHVALCRGWQRVALITSSHPDWN